MYALAIVALLGLGVLVVTKVADRYLSLAREYWAFVMVAVGMAAAWLADFDLFAAWNFGARNHTMAVTLTGVVIAGLAYFWREVLDFFDSLARKFGDEAASIEQSQELRRVA